MPGITIDGLNAEADDELRIRALANTCTIRDDEDDGDDT